MAQSLTPPLGMLGAGYSPASTPRTMKVIEQDEPIFGWRAYNLTNDGKLVGNFGTPWETRHLVAKCLVGANDLMQLIHYRLEGEARDKMLECYRQVTDSPSFEKRCVEHLERGGCYTDPGCGIWATANPLNDHGMIMARCIAFGTVLADDKGNWRASEAQIEELFVVKNWHPNDPYVNYAFTALHAFIDWERMVSMLTMSYLVPVKVVGTLEEVKVGS